MLFTPTPSSGRPRPGGKARSSARRSSSSRPATKRPGAAAKVRRQSTTKKVKGKTPGATPARKPGASSGKTGLRSSSPAGAGGRAKLRPTLSGRGRVVPPSVRGQSPAPVKKRSSAKAAVSAGLAEIGRKVQGAGRRSAVADQWVPVGKITHFFSKIMLCVVELDQGPLRVGDRIKIKGKNTFFTQTVKSLQVESLDVRLARKGQLVGVVIRQPVRLGDAVFRQKGAHDSRR